MIEVADEEVQGVIVNDLLYKNGSKVKADYISWAVSRNVEDGELYFLKATYGGVDFISKNGENKKEGFFGLTCCGASISNDLKTTMVGDFLGSVRVAQDKEVKNSIFIGGPIRYIHFHDFITNLVFVSGMDGNLHALLLSDEGE
jgi:hypothetical protein